MSRPCSSSPGRTLAYPVGAKSLRALSRTEAEVVLARYSPCAKCPCHGLRAPEGVQVVAARDGGVPKNPMCACAHTAIAHGDQPRLSADEWARRARVALRADELLSDTGHALDLGLDLSAPGEDEEDTTVRREVRSLLKQLRLPGDRTHVFPHSKVSPGYDSEEQRIKRRKLGAPHPHEGQKHHSRGAHALPPPHSGSQTSVSPISRSTDERDAPTPPPPPLPPASSHTGPQAEQAAQGASVDPVPSGTNAEQRLLPAPRLGSEGGDTTASSGDADWEAMLDRLPPIQEKPAAMEERAGLIQFRIVRNDGTPESGILLTGLKNIFQRQLPKMPREYITRLVFDRTHVGLAIVKRGLQVVGGITYKPFPQRRFAEIVFCAITGTEQVKGYGSHLMNHLKSYVRRTSPVDHFLTYADNYAIGYFKKQGFTKDITLSRSVWTGYIKDYEGGTLMQCTMVPRVEYLDVRKLLQRQEALVRYKMTQFSRSHIVHAGLALFSQPDDGVRLEGGMRVRPEDVPGLREAGWTPAMDELARRPKRGPHHSAMRQILSELGNHASAWPFQNPVSADDVPDYYEVIKSPMDLATLETNLENNKYATLDQFLADTQLIFDNCRFYNPPTSPYAKSANKLEKFLRDNLPAWKQAAGVGT